MRRLAMALVTAVACGKAPTPVPDSGGPDAGAPDAGVDAGPTCLDPDAGPPFDAGGRDAGDFSCLGQPPPEGAVAQLSVDGFVTAAGLSRKPVNGALIELFDEGGALLVSDVSHGDGGYAVFTATGCVPLAGTLRASHPDAGFFDAWYYPPGPFRRSRGGLELVVFDQAAENLVAALAQVTIQSGTAALALGVDDCVGLPLAGATVTTSPPGDVRYITDLGLPSPTLTSTSGKGQLLVFNLPPGLVTITAVVGGQPLRVKTVTARVDSITAATLVP